jgi:hypothetical protein
MIVIRTFTIDPSTPNLTGNLNEHSILISILFFLVVNSSRNDRE